MGSHGIRGGIGSGARAADRAGAHLRDRTIGLFLTLFLLFIRSLPMISIFEMRTMLPEAAPHEHAAG